MANRAVAPGPTARSWATTTETGCTGMSKANGAPTKSETLRIVMRRIASERAWGRAMAAGCVLALVLISHGALGDTPGTTGYGHHGMWGGGWGGMFFGFFMMLLVIAAIAAAVVLVARVLGGGGFGTGKPSGKTPTDILEERFARGEIDAAEFEERRRLLDKDSS